MGKKIIIKETQLNLIIKDISESVNKDLMVKKLATFLQDNYEPTKGTYKEGGEFHETGMVINKVNDEMMSIKSLYEYMSYKYEGFSSEFIKQVISDFLKGNFENGYTLSSNVSM